MIIFAHTVPPACTISPMKPDTSHDIKEIVSDVDSGQHDVVGLARGVVQWLISRQGMDTGAISGDGGMWRAHLTITPTPLQLSLFALLAEKEQSSPAPMGSTHRTQLSTIRLVFNVRPARSRNRSSTALALLMLTICQHATSKTGARSKMRDTSSKICDKGHLRSLYDGGASWYPTTGSPCVRYVF